MSFFIFQKNSDNISGTLYKIAENQSDLDNINIDLSIYKTIEDSQTNFNNVKYGIKTADKYNNNTIIYIDNSQKEPFLENKNYLNNYIKNFTKNITLFLQNNPNHPLFNRWNNYYNQLNSLNLDNISYPLNKSLEQYFNDLGQPSLNPLQLP